MRSRMIDSDSNLNEIADDFYCLYEELKEEISRRDKNLYERWKAGGFVVDTDVLSMYPNLSQVCDEIIGDCDGAGQDEESEEELSK